MMLTRADIPDLMLKLRFAHEDARRWRQKADDPLNPMARYAREEWNYHDCRRDLIIDQLNELMLTGISRPFTPGADREAEIDAFLGLSAGQIAAE